MESFGTTFDLLAANIQQVVCMSGPTVSLRSACAKAADAPGDLPEVEVADVALAADAVQKVCEQLHLSFTERCELIDGLPAVFYRCPSSLPLADRALVAALPVVMRRAQRQFRRAGLSEHDAEDCCQDVAVKVLRALRNNPPHGNVGAWLTAVRANVRRDFVRKCRRRAAGEARLKQVCERMRY
jgi:hypothetical protein